MRILTRLKIMTAASAALICIMAVLLYWSQHRLATVIKVNDLADEIVSCIFERTILRSDYLKNDNLRSQDQWLSKQVQVDGLIRKTAAEFNSTVGRKIIGNILKDNDENFVVFQQIMANRGNVKKGLRLQAQADEIEKRLLGQLLLKTYDTVDETRRLQQFSSGLIASSQRTAAWISFAFIVAAGLFVSVVTVSLGRIIGRGIENLRQGATAIGAGDLRYTVQSTGEDELAEVATAFNTMSRKLQESRGTLEREIEERKRAVDRIEHLNRELGQTVSQLQGANQELESFAYSVSHDLRAPLRAMTGFSQALVEDFGDRLEEEARSYLDEIVIGSRHMGQLIDGLLTLSRSTRGELRRDRIDLTAMTDRIRRELEKADTERRVVWRIEPGLIAMGDARMIEVVMRNLLGNAWKYTAGVTEAEIRVYQEQEENGLFFCVSDNGAGFNMAYAEKLFQPFQRLHRQDEFPGIGIGLATAQRIVHRHGGVIQATAAPHRGATFRFSLPYTDEQREEE